MSEDVRARRGVISMEPNPRRQLDYVIMLTVQVPPLRLASEERDSVRLDLRYVPDAHVLTAAVFDRYAAMLERSAWGSAEELATTVLDDFNSELVPRWIGLHVEVRQGYDLALEDRQPRWDNEALLSRLPRW